MVSKKIPQRRCLGCGESKDKRELVRIVRTPEGELKVDLTGKLNGRGAYVCRDEKCLAKLIKSGRLARSLESKVDDEIYERLKQELCADEQ